MSGHAPHELLKMIQQEAAEKQDKVENEKKE